MTLFKTSQFLNYAVGNAFSQIRPYGRGGEAAEKIALIPPPSIRRLTDHLLRESPCERQKRQCRIFTRHICKRLSDIKSQNEPTAFFNRLSEKISGFQ